MSNSNNVQHTPGPSHVVTDEQVIEWADGFILEKAFNRPIALQIALRAAHWVRDQYEPALTSAYARGRADERATSAQHKPVLALEVPPGPWETYRQPGGGWIANRINFASPGNIDRLPAEGQFTTEGEARAAIAKATGSIYVDCGECPRISTGCKDRCAKATGGAQ